METLYRVESGGTLGRALDVIEDVVSALFPTPSASGLRSHSSVQHTFLGMNLVWPRRRRRVGWKI
jgi:hypothetical protein